MGYLDDMDGQVEMAHPTGYVAAMSVLYVQGAGISMRIVAVPGSAAEMFAAEQGPTGALCECSLETPTLWAFTAYSPARSVTVHTIDIHEALALVKDPEVMFNMPEGWDNLSLVSELSFVPDGESMTVAFQEMHQALSRAGVPAAMLGLDEGAISVSDVQEFNVEEFLSRIQDGDDDA